MEPSSPGTTAESFGETLRQLRTQAGLSLRELGKRALYDFTRLSRAERGEILIPEPQVRVLDDLLHANGLLVTLRRGACSPVPAIVISQGNVTGTGPVSLEIRLPGGRSITVALSRRQFTQLLAAGALTSAMPASCSAGDYSQALRAAGDRAHVDGEALGYFQRVLSEYYNADKMLGPRRLIGPVLTQIEVLDELRRSVRPPYTDSLLKILAQYAEMAGWLLQDSGDLDTAANWSRRAGEWAQCAGDNNMAAYMLVRQANIAALTGDHAAVVQLAAAARRSPGPLDPKLAALALQQQARGHARLGEQHDCFTLLDDAVDTLREHPNVGDPDVPVYLHHYDLPTLHEQSAACYQAAGQADKAVTILGNAIAATGQALTRDCGHLTAKLAVAITHTTHPDPDRAATLGLHALTTARTTGSARILRELHTLDTQLTSRWPTHPTSRALHDALAA
jgi:transcriptional regulator with XRE-family HTH domain/tetratricopeptide (TPR) repeat protein